MDRIDIERKENGFKLSCFSEGERFPKEYVFNDGDEMLTFIAEHFAIYRAESPQDTDSTETMIEALPDTPTSETLEAAVARVERTSEAERDQLRASEPVQPVAGLSGEASKVDWQTGMIKPEVFNGSLPETE